MEWRRFAEIQQRALKQAIPFGPRQTEEPQELRTNSKNEYFHAHVWQEKAMTTTVIPTEDELKQSSFQQDAQLQ